MSLENSQELANTRAKLRHLETRYRELQMDRCEDARVRELAMRSLKRLSNQMKEEITVFEVHRTATGQG